MFLGFLHMSVRRKYSRDKESILAIFSEMLDLNKYLTELYTLDN